MTLRAPILPHIPTLTTRCNKRAYLTYTHARWTADRMRRYQSTPVHPYRCRRCQLWHVGSTQAS